MNPPADTTRLPAGPFHAILFDLDGTLIDSTGPTERAWIRWAEEEGLRPGYRHTDHGKPALTVVRSHVSPERVTASLARANAIELAETEGIVAKSGAREVLDSLPAGSWAIVTSCSEELATVRLAAAGLAAPEILVSVDDVRLGKPDPEGYLQAAARLGLDASQCLAVEDTPTGLKAAQEAGCTTLAVEGTFSREQLIADMIVGSLLEISVEATPAGMQLSRREPAAGAAPDHGGR